MSTVRIHVPDDLSSGEIYSYEVNPVTEAPEDGVTITIARVDQVSPFHDALANAVLQAVSGTIREYVRVVDGKAVVALPLGDLFPGREVVQ